MYILPNLIASVILLVIMFAMDVEKKNAALRTQAAA
jgi:hypothetical protein